MDDDLMPPGVEARPYQRRIVARTLALFDGTATTRDGAPESAVSSVLVESPTGSGKTVMGLAVARLMQRRHGMSVGWAAMRRNLLAQAQAENVARGFGVELTPISMFDKRPPRVDLLVVDEAQHDGALSMANLHGMIRPRKILGLSATPFRTDRFKLCFEKSIRDAGIHQLIADGYLSPYHHYTIPLYAPEAVAEFYAREPDRWGQSLIFFHTLAECRRCVQRLAGLGVRCELVTAKTDRERQIADFAAGRVRVMVNMLLLAEGFDCPALRTVFCRPSGKLCTIQMAGRALRKHPPQAFKQVVQCEQTRHPFPRTAAPAEQYLWQNGSWRSLTANRRLDAICRRMQSLIAAAPVELPRLIAQTPRAATANRTWGWRRDAEFADAAFDA
jgi:superfamily II DNA or RNA helicase